MPDTFYAQNGQLGLYPLDDYTGTDDQKMTAALAAVFAASPAGGTIVLSPRAHTFASQWSTSYSSGTVTPLRIAGAGAIANDIGATANHAGATTCSMSYSGAGAARMDFQHIGLIEISGILFTDSGGSPVPFFQTTNATPNIHDNAFLGSATGTACFQDAIVLGGTSATSGPGDTAAYQGYAGDICRNYFTGIRRGVLLQVFANAVQVRNNTFAGHCGSNLPLGAAIELAGGSQASGNSIYGNLIEMGSYQVGVKCSNAPQNILGPNAMFDGGSGVVAGYYLDINSLNCVVTGTYDGSTPLVYDASMGSTIISANRSGKPISGTLINSPLSAYGVSVSRNVQLGFMTEGYAGDRACLTITGEGAGIYPKVQIWAAQATSVTDGSTTSGSNVVTSATAAWGAADIGAYITVPGIAVNTAIQWAWTPSSPDIRWQASTAYAAGDVAIPVSSNGHLYQATTGGTSGSSAPSWPTSGGTVTDGTVTWTDLGTAATAVSARAPGSGALRTASATASGLTVLFGRQGTASSTAGPSFQNSHIVGTGSLPAWTIGAAAGSGGAITANTGTDTAQLVKITTGTGTATGTMATATVGNTVTGSSGQFATVTAANAGGAACITAGLHITATNNGWTLTADGAPPASTACWFYIHTTY